MATGILNLSLFNGQRQLFPADTDVTVRLTDGNLTGRNFKVKGPTHRLVVEFTDGPKNRYIVQASVDGFELAGFFPVKLTTTVESTVALMLLPHNGTFNFGMAQWGGEGSPAGGAGAGAAPGATRRATGW